MTSTAGFVLAAGLGTRIASLSRLRPKPLLPVAQSTPFHRATAALRSAGVGRVVANASHLAEQVVGAARPIGVEVLVERDGPRGTAGGLANALGALDADRIAVWNGDIVADVDVAELLARLSGADAVLAVRGNGPVGEGNVGLDDAGRVVRLRDRRFGHEVRSTWFAAVHAVSRELARRAPARGCLVGDVYIPALADGVCITSVPVVGAWHDIGDLAEYLTANLHDLPGDGASIGEGATIGPRTSLRRSVVGRGAHVDGVGEVRDVVVWPGVRAVAPIQGAIVVDGGEVVRP